VVLASYNHTDLNCLFKAAQAQISQFSADGACASISTTTLRNTGSGGVPVSTKPITTSPPTKYTPLPREPQPTESVHSTITFHM
jgi:hypothetical protein